MAVNRKNKSVNTSDEGSNWGLADLDRLEEQYDQEPAAFREMRLAGQRAKVGIESLTEVAEKTPHIFNDEKYKLAKKLKGHQQAKASLEPRMALYKESRRERINTQAVNAIGRQMSERAIGSYVGSQANSLEAQVAGSNAAFQGYGALSKQREDIMGQMQDLRQGSMQAAAGYIGGHGVNASAAATLKENDSKMQELARQLVPATLGLQQLKQQGLDPQSQQRALIGMGDKAAGVLSNNKLEDEMRSGKGLGALSGGDLRKKEAEAAEKLIKAMDELRNSAGKTEEEMSALKEKAQAAGEEFEKMGDARAMGGSGGGASNLKIASIVTSAVAQLANVVGNAIMTIGVDQPMRNVGNIAGFANIENQKYDMWTSAVAGNMTERMNLPGWAEAENFGSVMGSRTNTAVKAREGGYVVGTVASVAQGVDVAASALQGVGASKTGLREANTIQGLASAGVAGVENVAGALATEQDRAQRISESEAKIGGINNAMGAVKQLNHISGYQLQQYRDYIMGLQRGAVSMGSKANGFLDEAAGQGFMDRMIGVGLSTDEMSKMSQFGAENMGSTFNAGQVIRAKHYENQGYGSAQDNMQRMAMLSAGGSQNPSQSYEKLLERAVGAGMSGAKVLNIIAENTGQMAEQAYASGSQGDLTETISKLLMGAVNKDNPNKEYAAKLAADTFKTEEQWKTNTGANFFGVVNTNRMVSSLGVDSITGLRMADESTIQMTDWRDRLQADPNQKDAIMNEAMNKGMDWRGNTLFDADPAKFLQTALDNRTKAQLERGGAGAQFNAVVAADKLKEWAGTDEEKRNAILSGANLGAFGASKDIVDAKLGLAQTFTVSGKGNPYEIMRDIGVQWGWRKADKADLEAEGFQQNGAFGWNQNESTRGAKNQVKAAKMVVDIAGGRSGTAGIAAIERSGSIAEQMPGADAQRRFSTAATKSAQDLGDSAMKLDGASGKLTEAAQALIASAGIRNAAETEVEKYFKKAAEGMESIKNKMEELKIFFSPSKKEPEKPWTQKNDERGKIGGVDAR